MDKKELFDETLQATGCISPTYQRGNNSFSVIIRLPVISWNPTYWQIGEFAFRLENKSSAIILSVTGLNTKPSLVQGLNKWIIKNKKKVCTVKS